MNSTMSGKNNAPSRKKANETKRPDRTHPASNRGVFFGNAPFSLLWEQRLIFEIAGGIGRFM